MHTKRSCDLDTSRVQCHIDGISYSGWSFRLSSLPKAFLYGAREAAVWLGCDSLTTSVSPTQTLLVRSSPCELKASGVRNGAAVAIKNRNEAEIIIRYLQAKQGAEETLFRSTFWSTVGMGIG
jgi:hypothetical protein